MGSEKFEDTKGAIRSRKSKKVRQYNCQKFEDTKSAIRSRNSKKERQYNGQKGERKSGTATTTRKVWIVRFGRQHIFFLEATTRLLFLICASCR